MTNDSPLPDTTTPPSTASPDIAELGNQLQLVLGGTQDPAASNITSPITPSDPDFTPPATATTSSSFPSIVTPSSTKFNPLEAGSRASYASANSAASVPSRPLSAISLPLSTRGNIRPGPGRSLRHFHRDNNQPTHESNSETCPSQPIYWVVKAGLLARWHEKLDLDEVRRDQAYMIKHVPYRMFDKKKRSGLRVSGHINKVIHGTYYGRPSVFIGYDISHTGRKAPKTKVRLNVSTGGLFDVTNEEYEAKPSDHQPFIVEFAPKEHYGEATPVDKAKAYTVGAKLSGPSTITNSGLDGSATLSTGYALHERHTIMGHICSIDPKENLKTVLKLEAKENPITEGGVYQQFAVGMIIVTRGKPVVVTLDITPTQHKKDKVKPGKKSFYAVPVWIGDKDWGLDGMPEGWTREMSGWDNDTWKHLVKYNVEGETVSRFLCHFNAVLWLI